MSRQKIISHLLSKNYSLDEIAAILANIDVETGGTFDYQTKQRGGKGYGLFQFDYMRKYYDQYLKQTNTVDSIQSQLDFMHETIRGNLTYIIGAKNAQKLNHALKNGSLQQKTQVFCNNWEKPGVPHKQRRLEASKKHKAEIQKDLMNRRLKQLQAMNIPQAMNQVLNLLSVLELGDQDFEQVEVSRKEISRRIVSEWQIGNQIFTLWQIVYEITKEKRLKAQKKGKIQKIRGLT